MIRPCTDQMQNNEQEANLRWRDYHTAFRRRHSMSNGKWLWPLLKGRCGCMTLPIAVNLGALVFGYCRLARRLFKTHIG